MIKVLMVTSLFLVGCVYHPTVSESQLGNNECKTVFKQLQITSKKFGANCRPPTIESAASCLVLAGVIVPAGSFVFSSSVVVIENTLGWLEYHGTCQDGFLKKTFESNKREMIKSKKPN